MINLDDLARNLDSIKTRLKVEVKQRRVTELKDLTLQPNFWQRSNAKEVMQELASLEQDISSVIELEQSLSHLSDLTTLVQEAPELGVDLENDFKKVEIKLKALTMKACLSGAHDSQSAIISIHPGQGGTEAMDWASMLMRMYMRYFERKHYKYEIVENNSGEEAGIKSATFIVKAPYAYGYLKGEAGTHRLVRLSPFNADNLRQTSFALVEVIPLFSSKAEVDIKDEDLEWQFFRSGGAGGQNVNKVSTAVRVKHIPSGLVVSAQSERSQIQNRELALDILQSKLEILEKNRQQAQTTELKGEHKNASWGNQIRSYVLHPYQLIKDNRTEIETSDTTATLDGDLDKFIEAEIIHGV